LWRQTNGFDRDYSGGSSYVERRTTITLHDTWYHREESGYSRVSFSGMTSTSPIEAESVGTWRVTTAHGARLLLVLRADDGTEQDHAVVLGTHTAQVDGQDWHWRRLS